MAKVDREEGPGHEVIDRTDVSHARPAIEAEIALGLASSARRRIAAHVRRKGPPVSAKAVFKPKVAITSKIA